MAAKSANVMARVEPDIKEQAEKILSDMGISASAGINMFYRQIIVDKGLPFSPSVTTNRPKSLSTMSREEFDRQMKHGLQQAKAGKGIDAETFFDSIEKELMDQEKHLTGNKW